MKAVIYHILFLSGAYTIYCLLTHIPLIPQEIQFENWDVIWFNRIRLNGYSYDPTHQSSVAFFPLFPFIWRLTGLSMYGIILLNILVFYISFIFIVHQLNLNTYVHCFFLSFPSLIFMYIPYSESFFFLGCVLFLLGLKKENILLTCSGLFICGCSRPVFGVILPSIIIMQGIYFFLDSSRKIKHLYNLIIYLFVLTLSSLLVFFTQYIYTGHWLGFFNTHYFWDHFFRLPQFPLTSWAQNFVLWLDTLALLTLPVSLFFLVKDFFPFCKNKFFPHSSFEGSLPDKSSVFSFIYLIGFSITILFFQGGDLHSLNRYIFPSCFFLFFLQRVYIVSLRNYKKPLLFFIFTVLFGFLSGSFKHIQQFLFWLGISFFVFGFTLLPILNPKMKRVVFFILYGANCFFQIILFRKFMEGFWIG